MKAPVTGASGGMGKAVAMALGRAGVNDAVDIGKVAAWLASDETDSLTGASIFLDGGMLLYPGFEDGN